MAFHSRPTKISDLPTFAQWMFEEKWRESVGILESGYLMDPEGWITAETEEGELIGSNARCNLNENVAFGSFFFVRKDWRGRGVGKLLFAEDLKHIGDRNYGLNAVEDGIKHYEKKGFVHTSFPISSWFGVPDKSKLAAYNGQANGSLVKYTPDLFESLYKYDTELHTIPREGFLRFWINEDRTVTYCALDGDVVKGYGCTQPIDGDHYRIGPVLADTPELAHSLFTNLMLSVPNGKHVNFDIPGENNLSMSIVQEHGMVLDFTLLRMYTKEVIKLNLGNVYALTNLDIALV